MFIEEVNPLCWVILSTMIQLLLVGLQGYDIYAGAGVGISAISIATVNGLQLLQVEIVQ
jgi:hypothetical protein